MIRSRHGAPSRHIFATAVLVLAACTDLPTVAPAIDAPTTVAPAVVTADGAPVAQAFVDLVYATKSSSERLDLYVPTTGTGPFPVVVWIHPGGWQSGDKALPSTAPQLKLVQNGFALASVNYRLSHQAVFPAQIADVKAAVRWLRARATQYRLDPSRIGAWGSSAGGHLAALLGTASNVSSLTDLSLGNPGKSERVKAVVDWWGPTYFLTLDQQLKTNGCPPYAGTGFNAASSPASKLIGGPIQQNPGRVKAASPLSYVTSDDPPFYIAHGTQDCTIPWQQSKALRDSLAKYIGGGNVSLQYFIAKHGGTVWNADTTVQRVVNFFKAKL
jgi:acetyl esterase/lipase